MYDNYSASYVFKSYLKFLMDTEFTVRLEVLFPLPEWLRNNCHNPTFDGRVEMAVLLEVLFEKLTTKKVYMAYQKAKKSNFIEWTMVNVELTEADKKVFNKWYQAEVGNFEAWVTKVMEDGYKISHKYSFNQGRTYSTLSACDEARPDYQSSLTSHASGWIKATMLTIWKIYELGGGVIKERSVNTDGEDIG